MLSEQNGGKYTIRRESIINSFIGISSIGLNTIHSNNSGCLKLLINHFKNIYTKTKTIDDILFNKIKELTSCIQHIEKLDNEINIKGFDSFESNRNSLINAIINQYYSLVEGIKSEKIKVNENLRSDYRKNMINQFKKSESKNFKIADIYDSVSTINIGICKCVFEYLSYSFQRNLNIFESFHTSMFSELALFHLYYIEIVHTDWKAIERSDYLSSKRKKRYNDYFILCSLEIYMKENGVNNWRIITGDKEILLKGNQEIIRYIPKKVHEQKLQHVQDYNDFIKHFKQFLFENDSTVARLTQ